MIRPGPFRPGNPRPAESGPRFPFPAESGIGDSLFPGRIGNRGFPPRFPAKKSGIGGSDSRFPTRRSDVRASTAVDSEYTRPRVSCRCSHGQRAAPIQGLRRSMLLRVTCRNEHDSEGRIPRSHRPASARKDEESPGTGPMIEGKSDSEKGSWLFKPRVFFQFEFFSLGLWFCSEYFVVPTT
jgi:hypothetical protein